MPGARLVTVRRAIVLVLAVLVTVSACARDALEGAATQVQREVPSHAAASSPSATPELGTPGAFQVAHRRMTLFEPAHTGPTGESLGERAMVVVIWYPQAVRGPLPLLVFAPGFMQCGAEYSGLFRTWAGAGYVVAVVNFPRTDCTVGAAAYEPDLVNQPGDMSYVLSTLLAMSAQPHDALSGLLNQREIAAVGQSDGGDTVAALAADTCCTDHRLKAVAVLSGQEWPAMPGRYFGNPAPPMLFVQGTADTINLPWTSVQLYRLDQARARYYLDLFGANHMIPYMGTDPVERLVARVTLAFFDRYVLGQAGALARMTREGNVSGAAALYSGDQLPP